MLTKHLLKISLLLPLVAMSATAQAGSTITDKSYWPSDARQSVQDRTIGSQRGLNAPFAYDPAALRSLTTRQRCVRCTRIRTRVDPHGVIRAVRNPGNARIRAMAFAICWSAQGCG